MIKIKFERTKDMTLGAKVKYVRMRLNLSQSDLARELNVSVPTICRWELENRSPQAMTLGRFYNFCEEKGIDFKDAEKYGRGK